MAPEEEAPLQLEANYGYIALLLIVAIIFAASLIIIPFILSRLGIIPRKPDPVKTSTYECGMETVGKSWVQFNFRYYFYALLFVLFDIETVFLYPWAVHFKQLKLFGLVEMFIFIFVLAIGFVYAWRKGALEWK
jgi:NADH-quinone oxidoreductase subunit A